MQLTFLCIQENGKMRSMINYKKYFFLLFIFLSSLAFPKNTCESIYDSCIDNIPKPLIDTSYNIDKNGLITSDVNFRNMPLINSSNSKIYRVIKKGTVVNVVKKYYLRHNTIVPVKRRDGHFDHLNNGRYQIWYLINSENEHGFVYENFVSIKKPLPKIKKYRHLDSVNWTKDKINPQKSIEIVVKYENDNPYYMITGYAWDYNSGYSTFNIRGEKTNNIIRSKYDEKNIALRFYDDGYILIVSEIEIFKGRYYNY